MMVYSTHSNKVYEMHTSPLTIYIVDEVNEQNKCNKGIMITN